MLEGSRAPANRHFRGEDNGCAIQVQQDDQDRTPPGPNHGGFGGSDGARATGVQQGAAASGGAVARQAGRAPDSAFSEAAGAVAVEGDGWVAAAE